MNEVSLRRPLRVFEGGREKLVKVIELEGDVGVELPQVESSTVTHMHGWSCS